MTRTQQLLEEALTLLDAGDVAGARQKIDTARARAGRGLELMDGSVASQPRMAAQVIDDGHALDFRLPVWTDSTGRVRVGLPKRDVQHGADLLQMAVTVPDLLAAVADATR